MLIVKLPGLKNSNRIENIKEVNGQHKKTAKDRPRQYRQNQTSQRMDKLKVKKKLQNKVYKEMLKRMRQSNEELDKVCKIKQKLWKQKSRIREKANKTNSTTPFTKKSRQKAKN